MTFAPKDFTKDIFLVVININIRYLVIYKVILVIYTWGNTYNFEIFTANTSIAVQFTKSFGWGVGGGEFIQANLLNNFGFTNFHLSAK